MSIGDSEDLDDAGFGETSRYAAHLDRGWSLLDRAEFEAARQSATHAQRLRPDAPDAAVLLGAIALAEGDAGESLRCYDQAIELDPDYFEPYAAAAQVALFDLGDPAAPSTTATTPSSSRPCRRSTPWTSSCSAPSA
jgi:tetratricopeptide (TPR) repeat protein